jgi:WD40 repeat protein
MVASVKSLSWCSVCPEFFLATSLDQFVYLFDVREPWRVISQLRNSASWSTCTEFPPQSNGCLIGNHAGEVKILDFEKTGGGLAGIMKDLPPIWDMSISSDSKNVVFACGDGSIRTSEFKYPKRHRPGATLSGNRIFGLSEGPKHYVVQFEDDEYEKTMNELKTSINQVSIHPKMMDLIAFGGQQGLLTFLKK